MNDTASAGLKKAGIIELYNFLKLDSTEIKAKKSPK